MSQEYTMKLNDAYRPLFPSYALTFISPAGTHGKVRIIQNSTRVLITMANTHFNSHIKLSFRLQQVTSYKQKMKGISYTNDIIEAIIQINKQNA